VVTLNNRRIAEMKATRTGSAEDQRHTAADSHWHSADRGGQSGSARAHLKNPCDLAATFSVGLLSNAMNNLPVDLIGCAAVRASHVTRGIGMQS
jgi:hypothetical protein